MDEEWDFLVFGELDFEEWRAKVRELTEESYLAWERQRIEEASKKRKTAVVKKRSPFISDRDTPMKKRGRKESNGNGSIRTRAK